MKSTVVFSLFSFCLPFLSYGSVLPRDELRGEPVRPKRPVSAPGATRATTRVGPIKLPSSNVVGAMGMPGMVSESFPNVSVPCKGCTYTYIKTDMVYENGTSADRPTGSYMHHITLTNEAVRRNQGGTVGGSAPFYLIGNERLPVTFPMAGVYLTKDASVLLNVLLQNLEPDEKNVYIDMDYDYLPGQPEGYTDIIPVPQDALGMGSITGSIKQVGKWEKISSGYTVRQDARVLMMYGHVHDGGIHTEILVNGKLLCDSVAFYQDMKVPPGTLTTSPSHEHDKRDGPNKISHISAFGECQNVGAVKKGDVITTKVYYDFNTRESPQLANGKKDGLMGISMTYLGIPMLKDV